MCWLGGPLEVQQLMSTGCACDCILAGTRHAAAAADLQASSAFPAAQHLRLPGPTAGACWQPQQAFLCLHVPAGLPLPLPCSTSAPRPSCWCTTAPQRTPWCCPAECCPPPTMTLAPCPAMATARRLGSAPMALRGCRTRMEPQMVVCSGHGPLALASRCAPRIDTTRWAAAVAGSVLGFVSRSQPSFWHAHAGAVLPPALRHSARPSFPLASTSCNTALLAPPPPAVLDVPTLNFMCVLMPIVCPSLAGPFVLHTR